MTRTYSELLELGEGKIVDPPFIPSPDALDTSLPFII